MRCGQRTFRFNNKHDRHTCWIGYVMLYVVRYIATVPAWVMLMSMTFCMQLCIKYHNCSCMRCVQCCRGRSPCCSVRAGVSTTLPERSRTRLTTTNWKANCRATSAVRVTIRDNERRHCCRLVTNCSENSTTPFPFDDQCYHKNNCDSCFHSRLIAYFTFAF